MKALLWKDLRLNRPALILGAVLFLLPYLLGLVITVYDYWSDGEFWLRYREVAALVAISMSLSLLTLTILAGNAFAREREDRSAEFLACLPASRWAILGSKLVIIGAVIFVVFGCNLFIGLVIAPHMPGAPTDFVAGVSDEPLEDILYVAMVATLSVGIAWFCSSIVRRGSTAIAAALLSLIAVLVLSSFGLYVLRLPDELLGSTFRATSVILGISGMIAGTGIYVRCFEP